MFTIADSTSNEKACEEKNRNWEVEFNDGTPREKYLWNGSECKDMHPNENTTKTKTKKSKNENDDVEDDTPSKPKRAPARFVPINIPTRQIYLMPGML